MKLLLTNDDGIDCEGLSILVAALERRGRHEVYILAPDGNRSGFSHSISLRGPMRLNRRSERAWSCSGTPADCALIAALDGLPVRPDFVLSGINVGPNIGTDLIYSGTAAAARQAALHGIPAAAFSLADHTPPYHWPAAADYIADRIDEFHRLWEPHVFLNINLPNTVDGPRGWELTFPSRRRYNDSLAVFRAPDGHDYCFIEGGNIETEAEPGSDWAALQNGHASLSPVFIHPVVISDIRPLRGVIKPHRDEASASP